MRALRLATIGSGSIVRHFLDAVSRNDDVQWCAAYSRSLERAQAFIGAAPHVRAFDSLSALAQDNEIDAVYIASPTAHHCAQAVQLLQAGLHVLVEKPSASTQAQWQLMAQTARAHGCVLLEGTRPLFSPGYQAIKQALPILGTLRRASFQYCQYSSRYDNFKAGIIENAFRPELSNGALMDIGSYCLQSMLGLFGAPQRVMSSAYILPGSIDALGTVIADYEGMQCSVSYSKISQSSLPCEIQGERATLCYENLGSPHNVVIQSRAGASELLFAAPLENDLEYELAYFVSAIRGESALEPYHLISEEYLKLADMIRGQNDIVFPADAEELPFPKI